MCDIYFISGILLFIQYIVAMVMMICTYVHKQHCMWNTCSYISEYCIAGIKIVDFEMFEVIIKFYDQTFTI